MQLLLLHHFLMVFLFLFLFFLYSSFYAGSNDMTCIRNPQPSLKNQSDSEILVQEVDCDYES